EGAGHGTLRDRVFDQDEKRIVIFGLELLWVYIQHLGNRGANVLGDGEGFREEAAKCLLEPPAIVFVDLDVTRVPFAESFVVGLDIVAEFVLAPVTPIVGLCSRSDPSE